jgi:hypothetical protein
LPGMVRGDGSRCRERSSYKRWGSRRIYRPIPRLETIWPATLLISPTVTDIASTSGLVFPSRLIRALVYRPAYSSREAGRARLGRSSQRTIPSAVVVDLWFWLRDGFGKGEGGALEGGVAGRRGSEPGVLGPVGLGGHQATTRSRGDMRAWFDGGESMDGEMLMSSRGIKLRATRGCGC